MFDLDAIKNFSIDKSEWQKVKFGDVVFEPKESVKDPIAEGIEHVVGLEHISSEDILLRRSASIEDSTTFTKKFRQGDVLFGRRRAYLKKAAKAEFEGICSGDITVMRSKEGMLLAELLPFIVNNDNFFDYAITHSAGGLSPRVKFKDLANYQFWIPVKEKQTEIANLLVKKNTLIENNKSTLNKAKVAKESLIKSYIERSTSTKKIKDIGTVLTGNTPATTNPDFWGGEIPFVTPADINESSYINNVERHVTEEGSLKSRIFPKNSVLTVCIGSTIGKVAIANRVSCSNQQINAIIPNDKYNSLYILYLLRYFKPKILARTGTTAVPIINKSEFELISLPILEPELIEQFLSDISQLDLVINNLELHFLCALKLQKQIIMEVF